MTQVKDDQLCILAATDVEILEILRKPVNVGPETFGRRTEHFIIFSSNSLGANGTALADAVLLETRESDHDGKSSH